MSERWAPLMRRAIELAEGGRYGASPNPMVGAVVVSSQGRVIGEGAHLRCGGPHAEVVALAAASEPVRGATLVVNLEPCAHSGRTGPCVDAVIASGVARVVIGGRDPNPQVDGRGVAMLRAAGIEVIEGVEAAGCERLNRRFLHWMRTGLPFVTLKMAMTLDGKLAARGGRSHWITGEASRRAGYALREEFDAILVGAGTARTDNPRLRRHLGLNPNPAIMRVVLDPGLSLSTGSVLLSEDAEDVVIFHCDRAPAERLRELAASAVSLVDVADDGSGRCNLREVLRWLGGHLISSVLVEGGGEVHWSFLAEGLAQEVHAFVAPLVLGGREATLAVAGLGFPSPQEGVRLRFDEIRRLDEDLVIVAGVVHV